MAENSDEYIVKKKAIFDSMSQKGRERILRIGYENWEPFAEPKDPRERIFGAASQMATAVVKEFYETQGGAEESVSLHRELFELCRGVIEGDARSKVIYDFCCWSRERLKNAPGINNP